MDPSFAFAKYHFKNYKTIFLKTSILLRSRKLISAKSLMRPKPRNFRKNIAKIDYREKSFLHTLLFHMLYTAIHIVTIYQGEGCSRRVEVQRSLLFSHIILTKRARLLLGRTNFSIGRSFFHLEIYAFLFVDYSLPKSMNLFLYAYRKQLYLDQIFRRKRV